VPEGTLNAIAAKGRANAERRAAKLAHGDDVLRASALCFCLASELAATSGWGA